MRTNNAIPVPWARSALLRTVLTRLRRPLSPAILVVSLPRSGSSWVGNSLAFSRSAMYLREPITQSYLRRNGGGGPVFEVSGEPPAAYQSDADTAFRGVPAFDASIVKVPSQWSLIQRSERRIVIKEVNPLALGWILERYQPKVIYLIRHPAAVARSYFKMGWTPHGGKLFERYFSAGRLASSQPHYREFLRSFWSEHGAVQAATLRFVLEKLDAYPDHRIVRYEDLCTNPVAVCRDLFQFSQLRWDDGVEERLRAQAASDDAEPYGTRRFSETMIHAWKDQLSGAIVSEIREAYLSYGLPYYRAEEWR
jgi:hypothetical protein